MSYSRASVSRSLTLQPKPSISVGCSVTATLRRRSTCCSAGRVSCSGFPDMDGSDERGGTSDSDNNNRNHSSSSSSSAATNRKRFGVSRIVPEEGKKRVNYSKGDARRIMEEAVSLCEVMALGYEVVFHGRRRSYVAHSRPSIVGEGAR